MLVLGRRWREKVLAIAMPWGQAGFRQGRRASNGDEELHADPLRVQVATFAPVQKGTRMGDGEKTSLLAYFYRLAQRARLGS